MANFKSGFAAIVGRPNVGKSTLTNAFIGEKAAIVSNKPQTTRTNLSAIDNGDDYQIVFVDTPGMHTPKTKLGEYMNSAAGSSLSDVDVAILVVEAGKEVYDLEKNVIKNAASKNIPLILAILAAILYAASIHIDKYLITKTVKNADYRSLILVATMVAGGVMTIIYLFVCNFSLNFDLPGILILLLNAALYTIAMIFWFKSLAQDDTTIVTIMLQLSPVFMLLLSPIFLSEQSLSLTQLIGSFIVMFAAILLTFEPIKKLSIKRGYIHFLL